MFGWILFGDNTFEVGGYGPHIWCHSAWIIQWHMVNVYDANIPDNNVVWSNVVLTLYCRSDVWPALAYIAVWGSLYPHPEDVWIYRAYPWKYVGWMFHISLESIGRRCGSLQFCKLNGTYSHAVWVKVSDNVKVSDWVKVSDSQTADYPKYAISAPT